MTVKELKEELDKFDDSLRVYTPTVDKRIPYYYEISNVSQGVNEMDGMLILDDYVEEECATCIHYDTDRKGQPCCSCVDWENWEKGVN
jgi:hypothetical protein